MMKLTRLFACLALFAMLAGCATKGEDRPPFQPQAIPAGWAGIYLYREWAFVSGGWEPMAFINGMEANLVRNGSYQLILVPPGKHNMRLEQPGYGPGMDVEMTAGQYQYLQFSIENAVVVPTGTTVFVSAQSQLRVRDPVEAHSAMTQLDDSEFMALKREYRKCKQAASYATTTTDCDSIPERGLVGPVVFHEPDIRLDRRYRVEIESNDDKFFGGETHRNFELEVEQLGYIVRARNNELQVDIRGVMDGNKIDFLMLNGSQVAGTQVQGRWQLESQAGPLSGDWYGGGGQNSAFGRWHMLGGFQEVTDEKAAAVQRQVKVKGPIKLD